MTYVLNTTETAQQMDDPPHIWAGTVDGALVRTVCGEYIRAFDAEVFEESPQSVCTDCEDGVHA